MPVTISADELKVAERSVRYARQLERPEVYPTAENWRYIIEHKMSALAPLLYRKYLVSVLKDDADRTDFHDLCIENFTEYLKSIDREAALQAVYADMLTAPEISVRLVVECSLFDARRILALMHDGNVLTAIACLEAYQPEYTHADLLYMRALSDAVRDLEPIGCIKKVRGIFGTEIRYICADGHSNPAGTEFCETCGRDINGLDYTLRSIADAYRLRVKTLEQMLK